MNSKIAIIIVNWNGLRLLEVCLDSIRNQTYRHFDIYFVDNGSKDESVSFVEDKYPEVNIIALEKNTGFAKGNNIGINAAFNDPDVQYILTLNNDTKIESNFIEQLIIMAESNQNIGSVAPKILYYFQPGLIDSIGVNVGIDGGGLGRGSKERDISQYDLAEEVFGVCAGAALYRRKALEDVIMDGEVFDNTFFAYYEDFDLSWRLRLMGWKALACPEAMVHHVHSATAKSFSPFKSYHINRNRFFIILKDLPSIYFWRALLLTPYRYLLLINSMRVKKGPTYELRKNSSPLIPIKITLRGWWSVMRLLPEMMRKRSYIQKRKRVSNRVIASWFKKFNVSIKDMVYKI